MASITQDDEKRAKHAARVREYLKRPGVREKRAAKAKEYLKRPYVKMQQERWTKSVRFKFLAGRSTAKRYDIPWDLTFEEWLEVWMISGHWPGRGGTKGMYKMYRIDQSRGWCFDNVEIRGHEPRLSTKKKPRRVVAGANPTTKARS